LGGQKRPKLGAISDNFRHLSQMSLERIEISKIGKTIDQLQPLPRSVKKLGKLWCTDKKVIGVHVDPPKTNTEHAV